MPKNYLRRWSYEMYFNGKHSIDVPLDMTEAEVRIKIDNLQQKDNWKKDTLKREGKVKEKY